MAAGLAKTALIASCGAAVPTPPMDLAIGPIPMRLSPFVAKADDDNITKKDITTKTLKKIFMTYSSLRFDSMVAVNNLPVTAVFHPLSAFPIPRPVTPGWFYY
jgi:hypothetical protein